MALESPRIIAHRTCPPYAPENSLQGMRVAFDQDADGVEIDLRMSLDMRPYLMHDNSMWRTTGWPLPIELTPSAIVDRRRLKRSEETPPSLAATLAAMPEDKLLAVDVKTPWAILALTGAMRDNPLRERTLVWCSSERVVRYALRRIPECEVAFYKDFDDSASNVEFVGKAARIGAHAVSLDWRAITPELVSIVRELGLKVYSWHKEHALTDQKLEAGLDGLITDHPRTARERIEAFQAGQSAANA